MALVRARDAGEFNLSAEPVVEAAARSARAALGPPTRSGQSKGGVRSGQHGHGTRRRRLHELRTVLLHPVQGREKGASGPPPAKS